MSDIDFKKLFEEEFDNEEISVSEDLIARTMAAIKAEENKTDSDNSDSEKTETPVTKIHKKTVIKLIYGIAAALVIGFVGLAVLKSTSLSDKKSDNFAADTASSTANDNGRLDLSDMDSAKYYSNESLEHEKTAESPMEYPGVAVTESVASDDAYKEDCYDGQSQEKRNEYDGTVESVVENDGQYDVTVNDELNIPEYTNDESAKTEAKYLVDRLLSEYTDKTKLNTKRSSVEECIEDIRKCPTYAEITCSEEELNIELIYLLLKESNEDGDRELIEAVLIQDVTKVYFNTENGTPTWSSGKEYLELFEVHCYASSD